MKKTAMILLFLSVNILALTQEEMRKALDAEASLELGTEFKSGSTSDKTSVKTSSTDIQSDTYYDFAVYNQLVAERKQISSSSNSLAKEIPFLAQNREAYNEAMAQKKREEKEKAFVDPEEIITLSGFCSVRNDIHVESIQGYGLLDCQFEENDIGLEGSTVFASFVPVPDKYALVAKPIYLQTDRKKAQIDNGVILTIDQTSLNVANLVNDRKIKELLADVAIESNKYIVASSTDYLRQKEASQTEEGVTYNTSDGGNQVITTKNTQAPDATDYFVNFGIQLTSALIGAIGSMAKEDSYPLFTVYKHSQLYIDITLKKVKAQSVLDYQNDDLSKIQKKSGDSKIQLSIPSLSTTNN